MIASFVTTPLCSNATNLQIHLFDNLNLNIDINIYPTMQFTKKKSRLRETKHLSTDADSSTDAIGGWTKNTQKPVFFGKTEKINKNAKTQKRLE